MVSVECGQENLASLLTIITVWCSVYPWGDTTIINDTYTSGCMCKGCDCRGVIPYPSAGGYHSHAMNNGTQVCGDPGKFGMVCVQWI